MNMGDIEYQPRFIFGSQRAYNAVATKDEHAIYFVVDSSVGRIYVGDSLFASLSAEDIKTSSGKSIDEVLTEALIAINAAKNEALIEIRDASTNALLAIDTSKIAALSSIYDASVSAKNELSTFVEEKKDELDAIIAAAQVSFGTLVAKIETIMSSERFDELITAAATVGQWTYTKDQIDEKIAECTGKILTCDSSMDFPSFGDTSTLYVADDENKMYRFWRDPATPELMRQYVEIAGSGGGGGGGTGVTVETIVKIKDNKTATSVAKGSSLVVSYAFSSANTYTKYDPVSGQFIKVQQQTGSTGSAKYFIDGVQFAAGNAIQANYYQDDESKNVYNNYTIPASMFTGSQHVIKIEVSDSAGNKASEQITVNVASISITCAYTPEPTPLTKNIEIPTTVAAQTSVNIYYKIDNNDPVKAATIPSGSGTHILVIPSTGLAHNVHKIGVWATTYIADSGSTISTDVKSFNVIWYDPNNEIPIVAMSIDAKHDDLMHYRSTQYDYVTMTYQVYSGAAKSVVKLKIKENGTAKVINTVNVDTTIHTWTYTFENYGTYQMYLSVMKGTIEYQYDGFEIIVDESTYKLEAEPGADVFFTAKNRSNEEDPSTRSIWKSEIGDYQAQFTNFAWNDNSGWYKNGNTTALRVSGDARCTIPYKPFDSDYRNVGQVIEFDFSTTNLSNSEAQVITCYSDTNKSGIVINANNAYFISTDFSKTDSADSRINVPFKENERIRVAFVITPNNADDKGANTHYVEVWDNTSKTYKTMESVSLGWWRFVKIYINGVCVSINKYTNAFKQSAPSSIVIGSDDATVNLYSIRAYKKVLYDKGIVNNYVADTQDPTERMNLFLKNNILKTSGTDVDSARLMKQMPCLFLTCESDVTTGKDFANAEHILPRFKERGEGVKKEKDKRGCTAIYNCEQMDDEAKAKYPFSHSFVAYNAQLTVQGTSSQYYPRKNYKLTFKPAKKWLNGAAEGTLDTYNAVLTGSKPTVFFIDTVGTSKGSTGTGGTEEGKLNRLTDINSYKTSYKNKYTLKDFKNQSEYSDLEHITSIPTTKFCLKADFAESSGTHNTGMGNYVDYVMKSLGRDYLTPPQLAELNKVASINKVQTKTSVEGYPMAVFWRRTYSDEYEFLGKYNFNIDKGAEDSFGFVGDIVETSTILNPYTGYPFTIFNEDYYDTVYGVGSLDRLEYDSPVECWEFLNNTTDLCKFRNVTESSFTTPSEQFGMEWLGSFECRHPDNDSLIDDYQNSIIKKQPTHYKNLLKWVSSTDRLGYHDPETKNLKVPYEWSGTFASLIAGTAIVYEAYDGTLDEYKSYKYLNNDPLADKSKIYILEPQKEVDPATHEKGPDTDYSLFGHIAKYNSTTELWYDAGVYVKPEGADKTKWYYISLEGDLTHHNKVYGYDPEYTQDNGWKLRAEITQYAIDPITYESIYYAYDTAEYRLAKFKYELKNHMNINVTTAYYVLTEFFGCVDQRAKNLMLASWGYEPGIENTKSVEQYNAMSAEDKAKYKAVYDYAWTAPNTNNVLSAAPVLSATPVYVSSPATTVCFNEIYTTKCNMFGEVNTENKYIELYNPTNEPIDLSNYEIRKGKDVSKPEKDVWSFTQLDPSVSRIIPAKGFYRVTTNNTSGQADPLLGPTFGISGDGGFIMRLYTNSAANSGVMVDEIDNATTIQVIADTTSFGRETDGAENWVMFQYPTIYPKFDGKNGTGSEDVEPNGIVINEIDPNDGMKLIEIYNSTDNDINLSGYKISNKGKNEFTFGDIALPSHDRYVLQCGGLVDVRGHASAAFGISPDGGFLLKLYSNEGKLVDRIDNSNATILIPEDMTYGRIVDGSINWTSFRNHGSIGNANTEGIVNKGLYINEIDTTAKSIEFYNSTANPIDILGYTLIKDDKSWTVPSTALAGTVVPANGYLVYTKNNDTTLSFDFGISGDKGFILTLKNGDSIIDRVNNVKSNNPNFVEIPNNKSFGRINDGDEHDFAIFNAPTIGSKNINGVQYTPKTSVPNGLYINEVLPNTEEIEIYNSTDASINITGYILSKSGFTPNMWTIPESLGGEIGPKSFKVFKGRRWNPNYGPKFAIPGGEKGFILTLSDPTGNIVDCIDNRPSSSTFKNIAVGHSIGRKPDGGEDYILYSGPSIGQTNANGTEEGQVATHIVINEICPDTKKVEFYNPGDTAVNLATDYGLVKLSADTYEEGDFWKFSKLAAPCVIAPKGFFVLEVKQSDDTLGPTFGLSMKNESKKFALYLKKVNASTTWETALTAETVDVADNMTNPLIITEGSNKTWGRSMDAGDSWVIFKSPGTIGSTNANGVPEQGGESTVKTPLYYIPVECEYIYYPIFYDNDTILSLDNTGHIKFQPNVESTDEVGTGYAYNGTESALWLNFKDAFADEISALYSSLRTQNILTYNSVMHFFTEKQSQVWPAILYNMDAKFKYVDPATVGYTDFSLEDTTGKIGVNVQEPGYLYECQGSREEHRKWWVSNRFTYMDSRYNTGDYHEDFATMRIYTPTTYESVVPSSAFKLIPYTDMYLRIRFGSVDAYTRAEKNKEYTVHVPGMSFNDTETIIYGASSILSFGDLTDKYAGSIAIGKASKIKDLRLGADAPYYNKNLTNQLGVANTNTSLKNIDLRGCTQLTAISGLEQLSSIKNVKAGRTSLNSINFATGGVDLNHIEYPASISSVKLVNAPYIDNSNIIFENYSNIKELWIESCPKVNTYSIVTNIMNNNTILEALRITDVDWTFNTPGEFELWKRMLKMSGITEGRLLDLPYITGTITIGATVPVSDGYKETLETKFREQGCELTINPMKVVGATGIVVNTTGKEDIATNAEVTYDVSYLPDNYVKKPGVTWRTNDPNATIVSSTEHEVTIKYIGSVGEGVTFNIVATSKYYPGISATSTPIHVLPSLTSINVYYAGTPIPSGSEIELNELTDTIFNLEFLPQGTTDTNVSLSASGTGKSAVTLSYDSVSHTMTIKTASVSTTTVATIVIRSTTITSVYTTFNVKIKNIISRIITFKDQDSNLIEGNATVTNSKSGLSYSLTSTNGKIALSSGDSKYGYDKLVVSNIKPTDYDIKYYSSSQTYTFDELSPSSATSDIEHVCQFFEPISAKFTIMNGNAKIAVEDMIITSDANTIRGMVNAPYNNIIIGKSSDPQGEATIKLLAKQPHVITIKPVKTVGSSYSTFTSRINVNTNNLNITANIARDYLGDVDSYDNTTLKMTIVTGSTVYKTIRLYYTSTKPVVIDWGDNIKELLPSTDNIETEKLHTYPSAKTEYDISITSGEYIIDGSPVQSDLTGITWFHVIKSTDTKLKMCISDGNTGGATYTWDGGIVAYQAIGSANITKMMTFEMNNSYYSKLISIGNIYKKCVGATSADGLFKNTTLEQIWSKDDNSIFSNCTNITSFNETFKNSSITSLISAIFHKCNKAISFISTFEGCTKLSAINASEDVEYIVPNSNTAVISVLNMFKNCSGISDTLPALWKSFYACSFADKTPQKSFVGCVNALNYSRVPVSWGGPAPEYFDSLIHPLKYVAVLPTEVNPDPGMYGYFEAGGDNPIYLKNTYSYVFKYKMCWNAQPYRRYPFFGSAHTTTGYEADIDAIVDFTRNGNESGGNGTGLDYTGFLTYRNNVLSSVGDKFNVATGTLNNVLFRRDKQTNWPNPGENYPIDANHSTKEFLEMREVVLDIGYSQPGVATLSCENWAAEGGKSISNPDPVSFNIPEGDEIFTCNLPLRILFTYGMGNIDYWGTGSTEDPGFSVFNDPTTQNYGVGDSGRNKRYPMNECYFMSLDIYDGTDLIHKLVPAYAIIEDNRGIALYDTITKKSWAGIGKALIPYGVEGHCNDELTYYKL